LLTSRPASGWPPRWSRRTSSRRRCERTCCKCCCGRARPNASKPPSPGWTNTSAETQRYAPPWRRCGLPSTIRRRRRRSRPSSTLRRVPAVLGGGGSAAGGAGTRRAPRPGRRRARPGAGARSRRARQRAHGFPRPPGAGAARAPFPAAHRVPSLIPGVLSLLATTSRLAAPGNRSACASRSARPRPASCGTCPLTDRARDRRPALRVGEHCPDAHASPVPEARRVAAARPSSRPARSACSHLPHEGPRQARTARTSLAVTEAIRAARPRTGKPPPPAVVRAGFRSSFPGPDGRSAGPRRVMASGPATPAGRLLADAVPAGRRESPKHVTPAHQAGREAAQV